MTKELKFKFYQKFILLLLLYKRSISWQNYFKQWVIFCATSIFDMIWIFVCWNLGHKAWIVNSFDRLNFCFSLKKKNTGKRFLLKYLLIMPLRFWSRDFALSLLFLYFRPSFIVFHAFSKRIKSLKIIILVI